MNLASTIAKQLAPIVVRRTYKKAHQANETQTKWLKKLIEIGKKTRFGEDHDFRFIKNYSDFKKHVPIREYEDFAPYIDRIREGEKNILWTGLPEYWCKTSGTILGTKYIPLTKESLSFHIQTARNAFFHYINETGKTDFLKGKMIFLQGSPALDKKNGIKVGRLSGIVAHYVPNYLQKNRMPSWETNCIEELELKISAIIEETLTEKMSVISGIPPWVQMYFEKLVEKEKKPIHKIFPHFNLMIHGGVNYEPYHSIFNQLIGKDVDMIETYPASEGFIAYQDSQKEQGLLLNIDAGMFFEFIPSDEYYSENPTRISIADVELNVNYALILSSNAGLWSYLIGDTVKFVSLKPPRIVITGRLKQFISAFGEHVIVQEIEKSISEATNNVDCVVSEFTVAPLVKPKQGLPCHEWYIEFEKIPEDLNRFSLQIDQSLRKQNSYYEDLVGGGVLKPLSIILVKKNGFRNYMKSIGKLNYQNKIPHVRNDREIADALIKLDSILT